MSRTPSAGSVGGTAYVPVDGTEWRLSMGLRRLDPAAWLEVDARRQDELRRKAALLDSARDEVLATVPRGIGASRELLELVIETLVAQHPSLVAVDGASLVTERSTGSVVNLEALHPIEAASRLVQEDLCVLERDDGAWRLTSACVCFPSRWRLADKLDASLAEIHGPVPGFEQELARTASTFFDRLTVERPVWRLNWTLLDTPELHLPSPSSRSASGVAPSLWFRVERQTLRRLASSGAVIFTIRTYVTPLDELIDSYPGTARRLRDTLRTVSPEVAAYKGWTGMLGPLIDLLDARADVDGE